jgi:hypothetical protein
LAESTFVVLSLLFVVVVVVLVVVGVDVIEL